MFTNCKTQILSLFPPKLKYEVGQLGVIA